MRCEGGLLCCIHCLHTRYTLPTAHLTHSQRGGVHSRDPQRSFVSCAAVVVGGDVGVDGEVAAMPPCHTSTPLYNAHVSVVYSHRDYFTSTTVVVAHLSTAQATLPYTGEATLTGTHTSSATTHAPSRAAHITPHLTHLMFTHTLRRHDGRPKAHLRPYSAHREFGKCARTPFVPAAVLVSPRLCLCSLCVWTRARVCVSYAIVIMAAGGVLAVASPQPVAYTCLQHGVVSALARNVQLE